MPKRADVVAESLEERMEDALIAQQNGAEPATEDDELGPDGAVTMAGMSSLAVPDAEDSALAVEDDGSASVQPWMFNEKPEFGADDVAMPQLRLLQGLSAEVQNGEGKPGQWIVAGYPAMPTVTFVPVGMAKRRELRNEERIVICSSQDAKVGIGQPGGACQTCPMAQWRPNPNGNGKNSPPPCSLIYSFLGVVEENGEVVVLNLQKTATQAAKFINTMAYTRAKIGGFGSFAVMLESVKQQGNGNTFFVPKTSLAQMEPGKIKDLVKLARPTA